MNEAERYKEICKPSFDEIKSQISEQNKYQNQKMDKVIDMLQGIVSRVSDLERSRQTATGVFGLIIKNWQIIIVLIILATSSIRGNKSPTSAEINDIITKVQSLEKLVSTKPAQGT